MGETKRRGSQADRVSQAHARLDMLRPEKLIYGACQATFTEFESMEPCDMSGTHAILGGECPNYGESVISFSDEPEVVTAAVLAYKNTMEDAKFDAQTQEGRHLPYVDEEDKPTQR